MDEHPASSGRFEHTEFSIVSLTVGSGGERWLDLTVTRTRGQDPFSPAAKAHKTTFRPPLKRAFGRSSGHSHHHRRGGRRTCHWGLTPSRVPPEGFPLDMDPSNPATRWQTTGVLTAAMIVYALGAGITAAAGTRLALQLILITVFGLHPFQGPLGEVPSGLATVLRCLTEWFCIGQFARLLPALAVVAVSQAPSPESNPDSPLPVNATVVHCNTVQADRSEVLATKLFVAQRPLLSQPAPVCSAPDVPA